jgi:hypothetical protein
VDVDRRLTHVELLHAPGERALAARVFELLGCTVSDSGRHWFTAFIDTNLRDYANNSFYASEAPTEQLAIEAAMADSVDEWVDMIRTAPQKSPHFGLRVGTVKEYRFIVDNIRDASQNDPELRGRIEVLGEFPHDAADAIATNMDQAFVWTNVIASGPLRFGQVIEVQWHLNREPA